MSHADEHADAQGRLAVARAEAAWWRGLAVVLVIVGGVVAFLLVREVRSHRSDLSRMEVLQRQVEAMGSVFPGTKVDDLTLVDGAGVVHATDFHGAPLTLVLLLSGHCSACETSAPAWAQVVSRLSAEGVPAWMIVTDAGGEPGASARWAGLTPHAAREAERTWLRGIPGVPAAVLVDQDGVVRRTWVRPIGAADVDGVVREAAAELTRPPG